MSSNPDLIERGNMQFRLNGNNNSGVAQGNMNTTVLGSDNNLQLRGNMNAKFTTNDTALKSSGTMNTDFVGEANIVSLNADMNLRFRGNKNQVDFDQNINCHLIGNKNTGELSHNTNLELNGDSNNVKAERNTNLELKGDSNDVTAKRNTNLQIGGNLNNVTVLGTTNHVFKNVGYNNDLCSKNVVKILRTGNPDSSVLDFGSVTSVTNVNLGSGSSVKVKNIELIFLIDYVKEARIVDKDYIVGIFNFTMEEINKTAHISFDENQFDPGTVTVTEVTPGEFEIIGRKNGTRQFLTFLGSKISYRLSERVNKLEITVDRATEQD